MREFIACNVPSIHRGCQHSRFRAWLLMSSGFVSLIIWSGYAHADLVTFCSGPPPAQNSPAYKAFTSHCAQFLESQFQWWSGNTTAISGVIVGFLGVLGGYLTYLYNKQKWKTEWSTETRQAIYSARFDEGTKFLDALSELVGQRYFHLQRLAWAIEGREGLVKIRAKELEYFKTVIEWNSCYWRNRNKIRLLVNENWANTFLDYGDDAHPDQPTSLHYRFAFVHRSVMAAKNDRHLLEAARADIERLNWACSLFLEQLTAEFLRRATHLELLKAPEGRGGAEANAPEALL